MAATDYARLAAWTRHRAGESGGLRPFALAVALGLTPVPVHAGDGACLRHYGTTPTIEYAISASENRKRGLIIRECARFILQAHHEPDDNASSWTLAAHLAFGDFNDAGASSRRRPPYADS